MNTLGGEGSSVDSEYKEATVGSEERNGLWEGYLDFIARKGVDR